MKVMEAIDRFVYGAISLLMLFLVGIGTWQIKTIIDHEARLLNLETTTVKVSDLHSLDRRVILIEARESNGRLIGVGSAVELK